MSEPVTPNIGLIVPNTGDLPGAWGTSAINPNMSAIDGLFGGFASLTISGSTTVTLSASTAVLTPGAGPFQQNNACIFISGSQTGSATIKFNQPGRYIVHNQVPWSQQTQATGVFVKLAPASGGGTTVGAPPGQKVTVFYDGTNVDYVDAPPVGSLAGFGGNGVPAWWFACSQRPWLFCDGTVYNVSLYPALGNLMGSAYGGDGVTTFGVPVANGTISNPGFLDSFVYVKT